MKKRTRLLSLLTVFAVSCPAITASVGAKDDDDRRLRIIIENNTLSLEDGADWTDTLVDEWVTLTDETTAKSAFLDVLDSHNYTQTGADFDYITEINGLSAEDGGEMGGWMISLDGWITDEAVSAYTVSSGKLENGDVLRFSYSCSWGADLGYDWSGADTSLSDVIVKNGTVTPVINDTDRKYTISIDKNTESITVTPKVKNTAYRAKVYKNEYTPTEAGTDYKPDQTIEIKEGDVVYIGIANPAWMQSNYNNAQESIYEFNVVVPSDNDVEKVIDLINEIGTVTSDKKSIIDTARSLYDSLDDEQKAQVSNYPILLKAEEELEAIIKQKTSEERIAEAVKLIDEIGEVDFYSGSAIKKARDFYDALTEEEKAGVSNYEKLVQCEKLFSQINDRKQYVAPEKFREALNTVFGSEFVFGNEWNIINAARFEAVTDETKIAYVESVKKALDEKGENKLNASRSTVNSGVVTALTALGVDASDFYGYDLTAPLSDIDYVKKQGVNGSIYALIALDTKNYKTPDGTREKLIADILSSQLKDGGWSIDTWSGKDVSSDADLTAMALQALAPYYNKSNASPEVVKAVDRALEYLSEMFMSSFDENGYGLFTSYGSNDCESSAQVIIALCALNIDPVNDERFSKDGYSAYNSLLQYLNREEMKFSHYESAEMNSLSTVQGYTAAAAFFRFMNNKTALFDMTDVVFSEAESSSSQTETSKTIDPSGDNVRTGDGTSSAFALGLMLVSLLSAAAVLSRKKEND